MAQFLSMFSTITTRGLLGALSISLIATSAPGAAQRAAPKVFKVGTRALEGRPKTICVLEGKWADGSYLRYEAWDTCYKMRVRVVSEKDFRDAPSLGDDDHHSVADIPRGSEVLEITNGVSTTLIFRDRHGIQREILTRD